MRIKFCMAAAALLAILSAPAFSQAIGTATVTWTAPTQNTDGSPLTDLAGYKLYRSFSAGTVPTPLYKTISNPATLTFVDTGLTPGGYCYALTAYNASGKESDPTPLVCKTIAAPVVPTVPKPPANVSVTVAVVTGANVAPVYKILAGGQRSDVLAGFVNVGKSCAGAVVFTYRGVKFRKVAPVDVLWWQTSASDQVAAACS